MTNDDYIISTQQYTVLLSCMHDVIVVFEKLDFKTQYYGNK